MVNPAHTHSPRKPDSLEYEPSLNAEIGPILDAS